MTPDEQHKNYYNKNPQGNHERMSPETRTEINTMKNELQGLKDNVDYLKEHSIRTEKDVEYIKEAVVRIEHMTEQIGRDKKEEHGKIETRLDGVEDWQIRIGTKIAMWGGVGTFVGGISSALIIWIITK